MTIEGFVRMCLKYRLLTSTVKLTSNEKLAPPSMFCDCLKVCMVTTVTQMTNIKFNFKNIYFRVLVNCVTLTLLFLTKFYFKTDSLTFKNLLTNGKTVPMYGL